MSSISDTIEHLRGLASATASGAGQHSGTLAPMADFATNPGDLDALIHLPADLPPKSPLVVVLHGCTQTADDYDRGSGWSGLAGAHGFALLFPQQKRSNNLNLCFNWFLHSDVERGSGEAESIRQMVVEMVKRHGLDPDRVYITGLSAGGAMTSVMLATAPELFAGGAIIAGLPYGVASNVSEALERMRGRGYNGLALGDLVRGASRHRGRWPDVSVWQGTADSTVDKLNAAMIVDQWRDVHGLGEPDLVESTDGHRHRVWNDGDGRRVIEDYAITGLGHGTPISTSGADACGIPGPHMLEAGISSTYRIAAAWGLVPIVAPQSRARPAGRSSSPAAGARSAGLRIDPAKVINDALRAAGLIKP
jgi:poly(hydroxyalkanoate) depolymerase family esterase